jgi:hypothetical protein
MTGRWIAAGILLPLVAACGSNPSAPAALTSPATPRANVAISSITVSGEARTSGQAYHVVAHLRESGGAAATIVAVDLTFTNGATTLVTSHADRPIADAEAANVCPANGTVDTREFVVVDADASHAYAGTVQATVTFRDSSATTGTATATAAVPALPPPVAQTFSLTGVITDALSHSAIAGARVEVLNGGNAGKAAITDGGGTYVLTSLTAESFRLRASAAAYDSGEQGVTVPANPRADFELRRSLPDYAGVWTGSYGISACQDIDPPGVTPILLCGLFAHVLGAPVPLDYQFTLSQNGASVTGTYKLVSGMFTCPCAGEYGTFDVAGSISSNGTLTLSGAGSSRGSGVQTAITFNVSLTGPSTLTGTVSGTHSVGGVQRATFSGTILSGTR